MIALAENKEFAMSVCLEVARNKKAWAERTNQDEEWKSGACQVSLEMLDDYLTQSVEEIAERDYRYLEHRGTLVGKTWGRDQYIDPAARRTWLALCNGDGSLYRKHYECFAEDQPVGAA